MQQVKNIQSYKTVEKNSILSNIKELATKRIIEEHLLKAEDDIKNGRVRDAREVFKEWQEKYGI